MYFDIAKHVNVDGNSRSTSNTDPLQQSTNPHLSGFTNLYYTKEMGTDSSKIIVNFRPPCIFQNTLRKRRYLNPLSRFVWVFRCQTDGIRNIGFIFIQFALLYYP